MKIADIYRLTQDIEASLQQRFPSWRQRMAKWETEVKNNQREWTVLRPTVDDISTGGSRYLPQPDGSSLAQGYAPTHHRVKLTCSKWRFGCQLSRRASWTSPRNQSAFWTCTELSQGRPPSRTTACSRAAWWRRACVSHEAWDQHGNLVHDLAENCRDTDRASAALVKDLKDRGPLKDTLVIWGGEFGRTPMVQGGSDHHPNAFTMWLAGRGIKPGARIGETDDLGFNVTKDKVHVHDLHATILQLLGFDHTKLTYKFQGRPFRLTDVHGNVVTQLIA